MNTCQKMKSHSDYDSFDWKLKAYLIKRRDNFTCQNCNSKENLNVHHLFYESDRKIHDYPGNYLITLCKRCHLFEHSCYDLIGFKHHDALLSGMLSIDIYTKQKSREL